MKAIRSTYLLIGHVTEDIGPDGDIRLGGTVSFAAMMACRLGWYPRIVTAASPSFRPPRSLQRAKWHIIASAHTTRFCNQYRAGHREQSIQQRAACIRPEHLRGVQRAATLMHLAPVAREFDAQLIDGWGNVPIVITPQGWMRSWGPSGKISIADWHPAVLRRRPFAMVLSQEDLGRRAVAKAQEFAQWTDVLVVTEAAGGCTVYQGHDAVHISTIPAHPIDPTGAGDIFAAAFVIRYWETHNVRDAANFANAAASLSVLRSGLASVPDRRSILRQLRRGLPSADTQQTVMPSWRTGTTEQTCD